MIAAVIMGILVGEVVVAAEKASGEPVLYVYIDERGDYHFSTRKLNEKYRRIKLWKNKNFVKDLDAGKYDNFIVSMGRKYRLDPPLIKAVIRAESAWNPRAISRAGAQGLMQLMPGTSKDMDVDDPFDPAQNIEAGTRYLRSMLDKFNGDLVIALAAYNAGPRAVEKYGGVPPYGETRRYIKRVQRYYRGYLGK